MQQRRPLFLPTLRALAAPRRSIPVCVVVGAMAVTELLYTQSLASVGIDLVLCLSFWLIAPASWRRLCGGPERPNWGIRFMTYLAFCATPVALVGAFLPSAAGLRYTYMTDPTSLGVVLVLFIVGGWGLGRDIELEAGLAEEQERARHLQQEAERAQLLAIRAHLDPHFLFNTLNAIAEWCREDPETAERATLRLATMLRAILAGVKAETWPLDRELELVDSLFELHRIRDPERFHVTWDRPDPLPQLEVPPMVLLPLAENAMKHGPSAGHGGEVRLAVCVAEEGGVKIELVNPGAFSGRREGGQGIEMVEQRLSLAYEGRARLTIAARGEASTATCLELPPSPPRPEGVA